MRKQHLTAEKIDVLGLWVALFWICKLQFSGVPTADGVEHDAPSYWMLVQVLYSRIHTATAA
jgi:hypothetical protein